MSAPEASWVSQISTGSSVASQRRQSWEDARLKTRTTNLKALAAATLIALGTTAVGSPALAAPEVYVAPFSKVAVGGYDAVSYFAGAPMKGDAKFATTWKGAEFRFVSAANLATFKADPAAYAPQYGGYCAWAVASGYTAKGDPLAWKVVSGKLYLNYDAKVQKRWAADIAGNIAKGDRNWPQVLK
jgi:YHS domain-containing protein